jgi:hypothetical protein
MLSSYTETAKKKSKKTVDRSGQSGIIRSIGLEWQSDSSIVVSVY